MLFFLGGTSPISGESFPRNRKKEDPGLLIETERIGPSLIVEIDGELDIATSPVFREVVDEKLDHYNSINHLILDFKKVNFIDSSGLGVILGRFRRLNQHGGKISAVNASDQIKRILQLSGLLKIMEVFDDRQGALKNHWR
jgi:stage II sporulation protein AA (anti-sigma F factor antagonist)